MTESNNQSELKYRKYIVPSTLVSDRSGFNYLAEIVNKLMKVEEPEIYFDFSECQHFEANLCVVLGNAFQERQMAEKTFYFHQLERDAIQLLEKLGFLASSVERHDRTERAMVNYRRFRITDESEIRKYVGEQLLKLDGLPDIHEDLQREIVTQILEMYVNAITHGGCEFVYSCGVVHKRVKELHFTLTDIGRTIKKNVNDFKNEHWSGQETILWATTGSNSTKVGESGGFGLKLIQKFLANNGGKIQIVSADGFWEYSRLGVKSDELKHPFPGTIINLIFDLNDKSSHYLNEMGVPKNSEIF